MHQLGMDRPYLANAVRTHASLRDSLVSAFPDLDDQTLADTLDGMSDLKEMIAAVIRSALVDEALAAGLATRIAEMKLRLDRFEVQAHKKRQLALKAMEEADIAKLLEADFTASLRQSAPSVEVISEEKIPPVYWKPQPPKLDKQGILAALKAGTEIDGTALVLNRTQLSVRTK